MRPRRRTTALAVVATVALGGCQPAPAPVPPSPAACVATPLFADDFESGMASWEANREGAARIAVDATGDNHVLVVRAPAGRTSACAAVVTRGHDSRQFAAMQDRKASPKSASFLSPTP